MKNKKSGLLGQWQRSLTSGAMMKQPLAPILVQGSRGKGEDAHGCKEGFPEPEEPVALSKI